MTRRNQDDVDYDEAKGNAITGIADLMEEHGFEPTMAACSETLDREVQQKLREQYREDDSE